jgi:hypothetical protein
MRLFDRYFLPLMMFVFGWAFVWIPAVWVKRGDFANGDTIISRAEDPTTFWSWVTPLWSLGALLMALGILLGVRYFRMPSEKVPKPKGSRVFLWIAALWFIFAFFGLIVQFLKS